jgi:hypothetical protein
VILQLKLLHTNWQHLNPVLLPILEQQEHQQQHQHQQQALLGFEAASQATAQGAMAQPGPGIAANARVVDERTISNDPGLLLQLARAAAVTEVGAFGMLLG